MNQQTLKLNINETQIQLLFLTAVMSCNLNYCAKNKDTAKLVFLEKDEETKKSNLDKVHYSE